MISLEIAKQSFTMFRALLNMQIYCCVCAINCFGLNIIHIGIEIIEMLATYDYILYVCVAILSKHKNKT